MTPRNFFARLAISAALFCSAVVGRAATSDFIRVQAIFERHCLDCHSATEPEANLVLESLADLNKGGESGKVVVPGHSGESVLVQAVEGLWKKDGKTRIMPPGKRPKLTREEIDLIKGWVDAGAPAPDGPTVARGLQVPRIVPRSAPARAIFSMASFPAGKLLALGRFREVELRSADTRAVVRSLSGHRGNVNAVAFSPDGSTLFAASGENGLLGEIRQWRVADGGLVRTIEGHKDSIYALAVSPDGKLLASGSYDQKIKLWDTASGAEMRTLNGHNGAVFGLAFRGDGKILASGSADRTVKLWEVASGERRDTLSQPLKEIYAVAFSPDGKRLAAAGVDNRIRVWEVSEKATETTNPLLLSRFAHEAPLLRLVYSPDGRQLLSSAQDRTVKLWDAEAVTEKVLLEKQSDWPSALAFVSEKAVAVGRLDGSVGYYNAGDGKTMAMAKPSLLRVEPRGVQRGVTTTIRLLGTNLAGLTGVKFSDERIRGEVGETAQISVAPPADLKRGMYEVSVRNSAGESARVKLFVDDLPSSVAVEKLTRLEKLPATLWGTLNPAGRSDEVGFTASAGQTLVFDFAARSLGSKLNAVLTLLDESGAVLASSHQNDDPFLAWKFARGGRYTVRVSDLMLGGSPEHFYRLSIGAFPFVTGVFPLSVPPETEQTVQLIGFNLPVPAEVRVPAAKWGTMAGVPVDEEKFRLRQPFKLVVGELPESVETEPNDAPARANDLKPPCVVGGRIWSTNGAPDMDLFRFEAKAGQRWVIETMASQLGSPVDTKLEILQADGRPVERMVLQAVRDSAVNFRGVDSSGLGARLDNWEEMELNQLIYLNGDVARLFRMPQGPDSDLLFFGAGGKRRAYFDTTATTHALEEACYVVEPHLPGEKLAANGLPKFSLYYENDDDGERRLGSDSRVHFTAPGDGIYLIRVSDSRGGNGERYAYRLIVRRAEPEFKIKITAAASVNRGSGQQFTVSAERVDEFDGDITVEIRGTPPGLVISSPLVIQAGQSEAKGVIVAREDAVVQESDWEDFLVTAGATVDGRPVSRAVEGFPKIKIGDKPKLFVALEPAATGPGTPPMEITVSPGKTVPARLVVRRNGHEELVTFTVENLPFGVIVDNIGLSGVLIAKGQNEREIFLAAAKWVPEQDRLCFAIENQAGKQTSWPVLLHVRR